MCAVGGILTILILRVIGYFKMTFVVLFSVFAWHMNTQGRKARGKCSDFLIYTVYILKA